MSAELIYGATSGLASGTRLPVRVNDLGDATGAVAVTPYNVDGIGTHKVYSYTVAAANGAYAVGDTIGAIMALRLSTAAGQSAKINSVMVTDQIAQNSALTIIFFNPGTSSAPAGTFTDNAAMVITTAADVVGVVQIAAGDYATISSEGFACISGLDITVSSDDNAYTYMAVLSQGTPNYGAGAATALKIKVGVER